MATVKASTRNPWCWIPTLYFAQGIPYVAVNVITVILYKRLGISNTDIALYTGWLYLPWVIKPFWSPFVDIIKSKRWWTVLMQWIVGIGFAGIAFTIPVEFYFQATLAIFWIIGFASATHDIASDGFYMIALNEHDQAAYVGIRSTFYRIATIMGQGILVIIAGVIESHTGLDPAYLTVLANPKQEFTISKNHEFVEISNLKPEDLTKDKFIYSSDTVIVGTIVPDSIAVNESGVNQKMTFSEYRNMMFIKTENFNRKNGFLSEEGEEKETKKEDKDNGAQLTLFEQWIKNTFGDNREATTETINNFCIVGVRLTQKPEAGSERILIVEQSSGDKSIKIESTRLIFNENNWDKTAYLFFDVDKKIAQVAHATFKGTSGNIKWAWIVVFMILSGFFLIIAAYHSWILPYPVHDHGVEGKANLTPKEIIKGFLDTFKTFFQKKQVWVAILFMLLYRLPEAQLIKIINPFFLDPVDVGGLGLTTGQVGIVYGTIGIIALTLGGIIGGLCAAAGGLKKWLWPMAFCISLNSIVYILLSTFQPDPNSTLGMLSICVGMFIDQFGYGFGFTAFMLFMMYFSDGPYKTSHYAICTAFMALGMMLPGMMSGWLEELIGYNHFFIWTLICCFATWGVTALIKVDPHYGKKNK